jgi:hypothetical protein
MSDAISPRSFQAPGLTDAVRRKAILVAGAGLAGMLAGFFVDPAQLFRSYLVAFIFWTGLALGCLGLLMVHHLSGGAWGLVIRRILEAGSRTLPLMAVLFLPLVAGLGHVYEWAHPEEVARDPVLLSKQPFLNAPFWVARTLGYFLIWSGMAWLLARWSREQDEGAATAGLDPRFGRLSGPGLVVFGLTVSLAAIDWMMSVDPHWFSTIYGFIMMGGAGLSALAFVILCLFVLGRAEPLSQVVQTKHLHDLGKLLFAFVMLYAYFTFSQFLIIWSANLPEELPWYHRRLHGGWQYYMLLLVVAHFALPFAILLSANVKKRMASLVPVALLLFAARFLDIVFQVAPQFHETVTLHWMDLAVLAGVGGLWVAAFLTNLKGRPLLPVNDPYLREALADHGSH